MRSSELLQIGKDEGVLRASLYDVFQVHFLLESYLVAIAKSPLGGDSPRIQMQDSVPLKALRLVARGEYYLPISFLKELLDGEEKLDGGGSGERFSDCHNAFILVGHAISFGLFVRSERKPHLFLFPLGELLRKGFKRGVVAC